MCLIAHRRRPQPPIEQHQHFHSGWLTINVKADSLNLFSLSFIRVTLITCALSTAPFVGGSTSRLSKACLPTDAVHWGIVQTCVFLQ